MSNQLTRAEQIVEDVWNGGGAEVPKSVSEAFMAFAEFYMANGPSNGEEMLMELVDRLGEAMDAYDPSPDMPTIVW